MTKSKEDLLNLVSHYDIWINESVKELLLTLIDSREELRNELSKGYLQIGSRIWDAIEADDRLFDKFLLDVRDSK